jgi:hypothetical protein
MWRLHQLDAIIAGNLAAVISQDVSLMSYHYFFQVLELLISQGYNWEDDGMFGEHGGVGN